MEIIGLESFNGINYGTTTPDASNRDKPWFRISAGGTFLGWYGWNGSAWVLIPTRAIEGQHSDMLAITDPQGGQLFWVTGSACLKVRDSGSSTWKNAIPDAVIATETTYLFDGWQLVASPTTASGGWLSTDLTSTVAAAGLTGKTIKAVIVSVQTAISQGFGGPNNMDASIKATCDNTKSTAATDVLLAYCSASRDDSASSGAAQNTAPVKWKQGSNILYYCQALNATSVASGSVWVLGFIYT
jgi:hypothetical protein